MKYLLIEKSKRVSVKPYQRKGKYVVGYQREDPRNKVGEPFEPGSAFVGVQKDFVEFIQKVVPISELRDLKMEEFSFQNFSECKTIPKEPYLNYLENQYKTHPDYGGMYFHDIGRLVLDKTNVHFEKYPGFKKRAFLHEIGHHQWWYHITTNDRKEFTEIWKSEKVTDYAHVNFGEGFAEAYAEYRYGTLDATEFPDTYHLLNEIFERRKQNVMVEALEGKKGEGVEVKKEPWKGNVLEWVAPKRTIPPKTSEARARNWETFKGTIKTGEIDDKLPLTDKSQKYWEQNKSELGYANLRGLAEEDVRSILSAVRRGEASVSVNRMGKLAFYKLRKKD